MKFEEAMQYYREGKKIRRTEWNSDQHMDKEFPNAPLGEWNLLQEDWEVVEGKPEPIERIPPHITGYVMDKLNEVIDRVNYLLEKLED